MDASGCTKRRAQKTPPKIHCPFTFLSNLIKCLEDHSPPRDKICCLTSQSSPVVSRSRLGLPLLIWFALMLVLESSWFEKTLGTFWATHEVNPASPCSCHSQKSCFWLPGSGIHSEPRRRRACALESKLNTGQKGDVVMRPQVHEKRLLCCSSNNSSRGNIGFPETCFAVILC